MTTIKQAAIDTITALAEAFPQCFAVFEQRRRPLKLGIHNDVLGALDGAITPAECAAALHFYTGNYCYLRACREGASRVDLNGGVVGHVSAEEAAHAKQRLAQQGAKQARRREAQVKDKAKAGTKARNAGRIGLANLRTAAQARRMA